MIKAVIFDIDNTMYDYTAANEEAMARLEAYCVEQFSISRENFADVFARAQTLAVERVAYDCAAVHNRLIRCQCILELLGQPLFPHALRMYHAYWDTVLEVMEPEPGLHEFVKTLKEKAIRIGVGTDMTAYIQYKKLEKLELDQWIDFVVTSEEAGVEKPSPRLFDFCLEKAGCKREECAFIGDSYKKDVKGAINAGMHGIWYTPLCKDAGTPAHSASFTGRPGGHTKEEPEDGALRLHTFCEGMDLLRRFS